MESKNLQELNEIKALVFASLEGAVVGDPNSIRTTIASAGNPNATTTKDPNTTAPTRDPDTKTSLGYVIRTL